MIKLKNLLTEVGEIKITPINTLPNITSKVSRGEVSYRGIGVGKRADDFWKIAGEGGTIIKVDGKEYYITDTDFEKLGGIKKIRFSANYRK